MDAKKRIIELVDAKQDRFIDVSDKIWDYAETRFTLPKSADALCEALKEEGFEVMRGTCDMDDAIVATFGSGKPVIGILGEYDALPSLNQEANATEKKQFVPGAPGHGCGHNMLGAGSLAAAVAIKDYMQETGMTGTIKYFGCPGEESGSGKAYMARGGAFDGVDAFLSWHPGDSTAAWAMSSLANYQVYFKFKGVSAHAAGAPQHGRSALDAAELMSVGVNYLREHIVQEARVHYAYHDVGGEFPNVVQPTSKVLYFIRAPKSSQVKEIYERIVDIAKGAALMTGTQMEIEWDSACSELIVNDTLSRTMYANVEALGDIQYTEEETAFAQKLYDQFDDRTKANSQAKLKKTFADLPADELDTILKQPLLGKPCPYVFSEAAMAGSTDVGDASWQAPTAQIMANCYPFGTVPHTWEYVTCGRGSIAHKGMLYAGKVIAMTALDILNNPEMLEKATVEFKERLGGESYQCAIPMDVKPTP